MNIKFFKAIELETNIKATIHLSGKLGFNSNALKKINIDENKFIKIGQGDDFEKNNILYMLVCNEEDEETFKISKAGEYFYANTKALFDFLLIDYQRNKVIYDITELSNERNIYQLKPRIKERKKDDDVE
jgi:hypothetical protein